MTSVITEILAPLTGADAVIATFVGRFGTLRMRCVADVDRAMLQVGACGDGRFGTPTPGGLKALHVLAARLVELRVAIGVAPKFGPLVHDARRKRSRAATDFVVVAPLCPADIESLRRVRVADAIRWAPGRGTE